MRTILFILFASLHFGAIAQQNSISGRLIDASNQLPISGATILTSSGRGTVSDEFGYFRVRVEKKNEKLQVSSVGFRPETYLIPTDSVYTAVRQFQLTPAMVQLEQVVVGAAARAPLTSTFRIDMRLRPVNTGQDLLRLVPGLFIAQHAGGGKAEQLFLRGYDSDHGTDVAISVDGIPVNMVSHAHGQGYADAHFVIPETVERVDYDKGPYDVTKGDFATAGWVDLRTKDFLNENTVKLEAGSFGTARAALLTRLYDFRNERIRKQFYVGSEYVFTNGFLEKPQEFHRVNLFGKYTATSSDRFRFEASASAFDSRWQASGQVPQRAVEQGLITRFGAIDPSEGGATARMNANIFFSQKGKSGWLNTGRAYLSSYRFNLFSNFTFFLTDPVNGDAIQQAERRILYGYKGTTAYSYHVGGAPLTTEVGYGFRADRVSGLMLNAVKNRSLLATRVNGPVNESSIYTYLQQQVALSRRLHLQAGIRMEDFKFQYADKLSVPFAKTTDRKFILLPKVRLSYQASSTLCLYAAAGEGFHSNDARLIASGAVAAQLPKVRGIDVGMVMKPASGLLLKAALWKLDSEQEFVYVGDEGIVEPNGSASRMGLDIYGRYQVTRWLLTDIDLNFAQARFSDAAKGSDFVPLAPSLTSVGGFTIKTEKGFSASARYRYLANRAADEQNLQQAKGYLLGDILANYRKRNWELQFAVENVFNSEWNEAQFNTESRLKWESDPVTEIHFTPGTPRFVKLTLAYNF
ncbi:MAG: TonB-dependent receptor [Chitinophagaceae bacterium]|nr:MAG: TonB-dependent receptor [Chitinophagaceae bacterium]